MKEKELRRSNIISQQVTTLLRHYYTTHNVVGQINNRRKIKTKNKNTFFFHCQQVKQM